MRNVERHRNVAAVCSALAAAYLVAFAILRIGPEHVVWFGVAIASFLTIVIGLSLAALYHAATQQRRRLLRGERLLATWTIAEDVWSSFCAQQRTRTDGTKNLIRVREQRERTGVPVVITEESLMVDDDFYHLGELRELTWHETVPAYFDFRSVTHTTSRAMHWHLRVPASDSDPVAMRKIWDHFQTRLVPLSPASRVPFMKRMRFVSLLLIPFGLIAAAIAREFYNDPSMRTFVVVALVIAFLTLPLGVIVGGMTHWWLTRGQGKA